MEPTNDEFPILESTPEAKPEADLDTLTDAEAEQKIRQMSRRSFLRGGAVIAAGFLGWKWINRQYPDEGVGWVFRRALETNEGILRGTFYSNGNLAPTFPRAQAKEPRDNGDIGLDGTLDADAWRLQVYGLAEAQELPETEKNLTPTPDAVLTLADIKKLPRFEMTTEFKCIEGWSTIVNWAGARLADFIGKYPSVANEAGHPPAYVAMETPDGAYFVGLERESAMHPQTLLAYEMNGEPLTEAHGAPLRLVIPVKYGVKNIKRIGLIRFTDERPKDYWAQLGYDWYAGL